jgi:hypothetical protein
MNHRDMKALAENAEAVRSLAGYLLQLAQVDDQVQWTDWELDFLGHMQLHEDGVVLTLRQVEVLVELRDHAKTYTSLDGMSVVSLINDVWLARYELDEEDEQFVSALKMSASKGVKRRAAQRLLALARQAGLVEGYVALAS